MLNKTAPEPVCFTKQCMETLLDVVSDGIWDWNANTNYVYRSPGWYLMLGYQPHCFENSVVTWENVIHPDDYVQIMQIFDACINKEIEQYQARYRCRTSSGDFLWIEDTAKVVEWNPDGSVARMIGAHHNIQCAVMLKQELEESKKSLKKIENERNRALARMNRELQQKIDEVEKLATTDPLTGASNRRHFESVAHQEIERSHRFNEPMSIVLMDIDFFKDINDMLGHSGGDQALITVTGEIRRHIRSIDLLARWGGDELVILLPHTALEDSVGVAEKIRMAIELIAMDEQITLSLGVSALTNEDGLNELLKRADQALYRSKHNGRNRVSY